MLLTEHHCAVSPGTDLSSLWRSAADFLMYLLWKYKIYFWCCRLSTWYIPSIFSSTLSTTSHSLKRRLLNLQWYVLSFTSIFSRCCLQYASVLEAGIIFQAINWILFYFFFLYPEEKGPLLVVSVIKHIHNNPEYEASAHFMHVRQLLTHCGRVTKICVFNTVKLGTSASSP